MNLLDGLLKPEHRSTPRSLTPDDFDGFVKASGRRKQRGLKPPIEDVLAYFKHKHGLRLRRIKKDLQWFEAECHKFGYDPRDILGKY